MAGDYFESQYASVSPCALIDVGSNLLLHSDTPGGTSWTLGNATAGNNVTTGPDGHTDAYYFAETATTASHYTSQTVGVSAAVQDFTLSAFLKPANRSWCYLQMNEGGSGTSTFAYFNIATGVVGTVNAGAGWANLRTFSENYGDGWFRLSIIARKISSGTSIVAILGAATGDGGGSYLGITSPVAQLLTWRASLARSSFPTRAVGTTTVAITGVPIGKSMWLKGLPPSSQGLLLPGDLVQFGAQLSIVSASLDSNAAGLGYLQFVPPIRTSPVDNDPLIVLDPMSRFVFTGSFPEWQNEVGGFSTSTVDLEEAGDNV
jgi:hypothetical protein